MRSKWFVQLVLTLLGLWMAVVLSRQLLEFFFDSGGRIEQSQKDLAELEAENRQLKDEKAYRETNFFVEKEAREKLGYAAEGEATVIFRQEQASVSAEVEKEDEIPNWKRWLDFLF